jgi:hypothetical protein
MKCSLCMRELPDGAMFCPACATPVDFSSTPTVTRVDSPAARAVRAGLEEHAGHTPGAAPAPPRIELSGNGLFNQLGNAGTYTVYVQVNSSQEGVTTLGSATYSDPGPPPPPRCTGDSCPNQP